MSLEIIEWLTAWELATSKTILPASSQGLFAGELARPIELDPTGLGALAAALVLAVQFAIELGQSPSTASMRRRWGVVVSDQTSARSRNDAPI